MQIKTFERYAYYIVCIVEWKKQKAKLFTQYDFDFVIPPPHIYILTRKKEKYTKNVIGLFSLDGANEECRNIPIICDFIFSYSFMNFFKLS